MMNTGVVPDANVGLNSGRWFKSPNLRLNGVLPSYISQFDKNRYYTSTTGQRAFPYAATRAGNALMWDSQGRLVWAPANMILSNVFTDASWTASGAASFSLVGSGPVAASYAYTEGSTGSGGRPTAAIVTNANQLYTFSIYLKRSNTDWVRVAIADTTAGANQARIWVDLANGVIGTNSTAGTGVTYVSSTIEAAGDGWYRVSITVQNASTTTYPYFFTASGDGAASRADVGGGPGVGGEIYVSAPQLECNGQDSPKAYCPTTGSDYYGPRLEYNPATGAARGLLVEVNLTNNCPQSFPGISSGTNVGITQDTSFHGFPTNFCLADGTTSAHFVYTSSITPTASATLRLSAVVKAGSNSRVQLSGSSAWAATDVYANFNVSTGTVLATGAGASNATITPLGSGWYQIGLTCTASGTPGSGTAVVLAHIDTDAATRLAPNNLSTSFYYTFMSHYETDRLDLSLIPTYGAAVTRAADNITETIGAWLDQTKGTGYVAYEPVTSPHTSYVEDLWAISAGNPNDSVSFRVANGGGGAAGTRIATAGSVTFSPTTPNGLVSKTQHKLALMYNSPNRSIVLDGGTLGTATTPTFPTSGFTRFDIGTLATNNKCAGWFKEVRYYPDASASNAQLQALTT